MKHEREFGTFAHHADSDRARIEDATRQDAAGRDPDTSAFGRIANDDSLKLRSLRGRVAGEPIQKTNGDRELAGRGRRCQQR